LGAFSGLPFCLPAFCRFGGCACLPAWVSPRCLLILTLLPFLPAACCHCLPAFRCRSAVGHWMYLFVSCCGGFQIWVPASLLRAACWISTFSWIADTCLDAVPPPRDYQTAASPACLAPTTRGFLVFWFLLLPFRLLPLRAGVPASRCVLLPCCRARLLDSAPQVGCQPPACRSALPAALCTNAAVAACVFCLGSGSWMTLAAAAFAVLLPAATKTPYRAALRNARLFSCCRFSAVRRRAQCRSAAARAAYLPVAAAPFCSASDWIGCAERADCSCAWIATCLLPATLPLACCLFCRGFLDFTCWFSLAAFGWIMDY